MIFDVICMIFDAVILTIYLHKILGKRKESVSAALYVGCLCLVEIFLIFLMRYFGGQHTSFRVFLSNIASFTTTFFLTILYKKQSKAPVVCFHLVPRICCHVRAYRVQHLFPSPGFHGGDSFFQ